MRRMTRMRLVLCELRSTARGTRQDQLICHRRRGCLAGFSRSWTRRGSGMSGNSGHGKQRADRDCHRIQILPLLHRAPPNVVIINNKIILLSPSSSFCGRNSCDSIHVSHADDPPGRTDDVEASVASVAGDLLLGQSFLRRFRSWAMDNQAGVLVLN